MSICGAWRIHKLCAILHYSRLFCSGRNCFARKFVYNVAMQFTACYRTGIIQKNFQKFFNETTRDII